ncbi:electron transfer flavoprotein subunit alpha/FixB family protein [Dysosmobacter sp.]|uniref:electron transfer flavoprotein subunit alpha/FixB family protein n=1 Tax=Dysosmobacter sp. TaxID=2591382 RepID=UPI002A8A46E5|nr:electron transfer flavoprotein subunit alpha/FixB family protein [Dysosmobacter sp.]MDY3984769.1 electron transfer flavoprotein subunit alpha/FixB family protein [Dysosmobacter sp.]
MSKDIFVVIEQRNGHIQKVSYELIGEATKLAADLGEQVVAVLMGYQIADKAETLIHYGASKVLVLDEPVLEHYTTEPYVKGIEYVIKNYEPNVVLFGASSIGRDMAPRIAGRIHTGLTADCTRLDVDVAKYQEYLRKSTNVPEEKIIALDTSDRNLKMTRPAFGGNVMATIVCRNYRPQMATVRPGVMAMPEKDTSRTGEIIKVESGLTMADMNVEILDVVHSDKKAVDITDAKILVSGGRGVGGPEGYEPLRALAAELGGEVSSSRIGVDSGWIEKSRQVGQTGKTVHPNLYIACGISGAIQHLAGMEDSEFIIAINKDETCPMMKLADLGIVGDLHVIVPKLTEAIKAYKASQSV